MAIDNCENLNPTFGCSWMDNVKELMLCDYQSAADVCRKQCCFGCDDRMCGYRCNYEGPVSAYDMMDEDTLMALMNEERSDNIDRRIM